MTLSTHVLDSASGLAAAGVPVRLERRTPAQPLDGPAGGLQRTPPPGAPSGPAAAEHWTVVATGVTDTDGRLRDWVPAGAWGAGDYRLVFDTGSYFSGHRVTGFFPQVVVVFTVADPDRHHHVPLLLGPYSYTTYRGT
jgi:5-hydroxyisourate hydrolase